MAERTEVRVPEGSALQVRQAAGDSGPGKLEGLAAVYGQMSKPLPDSDGNGFVEVIEPGAFDSTDLSDVRVLFNHDANQILARNSAGTAEVSATSEGLFFRAELPDSPIGRTVGAAVQRGDVSQASFAFRVRDGGARWERRDSHPLPIRHLTDIELVSDVSPVVYAAYPQTEVQARQAHRELRAFREAGCPDGWVWNEEKGTCEREVCATEVRLLDARLDAATMQQTSEPATSRDAPDLGYSTTAAHEAGHVVMARTLGLEFNRANISGHRGFVTFKGGASDRERALFFAAAKAAERLLCVACYGGHGSDSRRLKSACKRIVYGRRTIRHYGERQEIAKKVRQIREEAYRMLAREREHLAAVARKLERTGELSSRDFVG